MASWAIKEQTMRTSGVAALLLWQCRQPAAFRIIGNLRTQAPIRTALTASTRSRGIESSDTCNINNDMRNPKRRDAVSIFTSISASIALGIPFPSHAVKGAAEYDLEYYLRDAFMGNNKEGNLPVSKGPPPRPPRQLGGPLLPLLLDDELTSCIVMQEFSRVSNTPVDELGDQVKSFRSKVARAFQVSHPYVDESVSDEYFFDLTCYSIWRVASVRIQDFSKRDLFVRNVGRKLLDEVIKLGLVPSKDINTLQSGGGGLTNTLPAVIGILEVFRSSGFCTKFQLGDKNDEFRTGMRAFDELDDEELRGGGSIDCLVSVLDASTLGGSLQINGEGSRFYPDFVGPVLSAIWERIGRVSISYESYFVDPVYRPNPKDFFPDEMLYQYTIKGGA